MRAIKTCKRRNRVRTMNEIKKEGREEINMKNT